MVELGGSGRYKGKTKTAQTGERIKGQVSGHQGYLGRNGKKGEPFYQRKAGTAYPSDKKEKER